MSETIEITKCRICNSENLKEIISLGNQYVTGFVDSEEVNKFLQEKKPEVVIDTVALTSSFACERNPELCKKLNYETAKNVLEACKSINAKMIFLSSTYIFDGEKGDYSESDSPNPLNEYGKTKVMAEKEILDYENSIVIRVDIMYGYNGKDEKNGVLGSSVLSGNKVKISTPNQIRQPVPLEDVINIINNLIKKKEKGLFHIAGKTRVGMLDFLKRLEKIVRNESLISEGEGSVEGSLPKIPQNATLNISKIENLGFKTRTLEEGLEILKKQYSEDN